MVAVTKHAKSPSELALVEAKARSHGLDSDHFKTFMTLRYTGMHLCCLYRPEAIVTEYQKGQITYTKWSRPMKGAKKGHKNLWKKLPEFPKSNKIDFNIQEFYEEIVKRKRKTGNMYFYRIITKLGIEAGISDISPNTLRNSHAIYLIDVVKLKLKDVAAFMGCSLKTLTEHYNAYGRKTSEEKIIAADALR